MLGARPLLDGEDAMTFNAQSARRRAIAATAGTAMLAGIVESKAQPSAPPVGERSKRFVNVMDFGAHPARPGTANRAAFQAAIDSIVDAGTIHIPAGNYRIDDQLLVAGGRSISFIGQSRDSTILSSELASADRSRSLIRIAGTSDAFCQHVTIANLTLRARNFGKGLSASYCFPKLTIRDVCIFKAIDDGLYLEDCWGASVHDLDVDGDNATQGHGIELINANAICLYNPRVYNLKSATPAVGIHATSAECLNVIGGNIENCPRGIHIQVGGVFNGPVQISGVYFEPRAMQPIAPGQPNDHILVEGDSRKAGTVLITGCLFQAGHKSVPIAFNAVRVRRVACAVLDANVWQKARYTDGGHGENVFVDADESVGRVIERGNYLLSVAHGSLRKMSGEVALSASNQADTGPLPDLISSLTISNELAVGQNARPLSDAAAALGTGQRRWSSLYLATGAISTSDARAKQQTRELSEAERRVAVRIKGLVRAFKFKDAVAEKGARARVHFGVVAQQVRDAFAAEGLEAEHYALFCKDEWGPEGETLDAQGRLLHPTQSAGERYGVRYEELLAFVISAI
jgi:Pectate lyase superfamily protein